MAEPKSRAVIVGKLLLLVALPLFLLASLFATGVHLGHKHRATILKLERDVLGMDVEVPLTGDGRLAAMLDRAATSLGPSGAAAAAATGAGGGIAGPLAGTGGAAAPSGPANSWPQANPPTGTQPAGNTGEAAVPTNPPALSPPAVHGPAADGPPSNPAATGPANPTLGHVYPMAIASTVSDDLRAAYDRLRVLKVKVLVDRAYIDSHEDWLAQVQGLMAAASANQSELFGMQLQLWGVVEWDVPGRGLDVEQLHADLKTRHREGADLLLGITGRPLDHTRRNGWSETPARKSARNTAFSVVYADSDRPDRLLRAVLHEFAHCFGAHDVTDPATEAWRKGSVMSYANVSSETAPWFDPESLRAVLSRKHHDIEAADESPVVGVNEHADESETTTP